jgi:lipoprotein signal peptidase
MTARWTQRNPRWTWLATVAILLLLDESTKSYFSTILEQGEAVQVTDWLNFVHVPNTGAAFSLLADVFIVCATLTWYLFSLRAPIRKTPEEPRS